MDIVFGISTILGITGATYFFKKKIYDVDKSDKNKIILLSLVLLILFVITLFILFINIDMYEINKVEQTINTQVCVKKKSNLFNLSKNKNLFYSLSECNTKAHDINSKNIINIQDNDINIKSNLVEKVFIVIDINESFYIENFKLHKALVDKNGNHSHNFDTNNDAINFVLHNAIYIDNKNSFEYKNMINYLYYFNRTELIKFNTANNEFKNSLLIKPPSLRILLFYDKEKRNTQYFKIAKKYFVNDSKEIYTNNCFIENVITSLEDKKIISSNSDIEKFKKLISLSEPTDEDINIFIDNVFIYETGEKLNYSDIFNSPKNISNITSIKEHNLNKDKGQNNTVCKKRVLEQLTNKRLNDIKFLSDKDYNKFIELANECDKNPIIFYQPDGKFIITKEMFEEFLDENINIVEDEITKFCIGRLNKHIRDEYIGKGIINKEVVTELYINNFRNCAINPHFHIPQKTPKMIDLLILDFKHIVNNTSKSICVESAKKIVLGDNYENLNDENYSKFIEELKKCKN